MIRSPLYYTGDKFKVLEQIIPLIDPKKRFVDPFVGGGSILANIHNKNILVNDKNKNLIKILKFISKQKSGDDLLKKITKVAKSYGLTTSYCKKYNVNGDKKFYSRINKEPFNNLKNDFNKKYSTVKLLVLIIYSYNRLFRFNQQGKYNVPVGTLDLNSNAARHIVEYTNSLNKKNIIFESKEFKDILTNVNKHDIVFIDPPYIVTNAEYNLGWSEQDEIELYKIIDEKIHEGVQIIVTNYSHRGDKINEVFNNWRKKYKNIKLKSFYYSHHNNAGAQANEYLVIAGGKNV